MLSQELIYSEERGTWNLFVDNEWYYEGTYEQCEEAMLNNAICDAEEECGYYDEPYPEEEWDEDLDPDVYCDIDLAREVAYAEVMD